MKIVLNHFEDDYAVVELEDKQLVNMPKSLIPETAKEGCVLLIKVEHKWGEIQPLSEEEKMKRLIRYRSMF